MALESGSTGREAVDLRGFHSLEGKIAIVTGGSGAIGSAIVDVLVQNRACIHIFDFDEDANQKIRKKYKDQGIRIWVHAVDLVQRDAVKTEIEAVVALHHRIDILVNNAAFLSRVSFDEMQEEQWDQMMNTNLKSFFYLLKPILPLMKQNNSGKIINISSITYMMGTAGCTHYNATKMGMIGLTRSLAREYGEFNIHVNCVTPGAILTQKELSISEPQTVDATVQRQCLKRRLLPIDVAKVVLFLASTLGDAITGQNIIVDGGNCHG